MHCPEYDSRTEFFALHNLTERIQIEVLHIIEEEGGTTMALLPPSKAGGREPKSGVLPWRAHQASAPMADDGTTITTRGGGIGEGALDGVRGATSMETKLLQIHFCRYGCWTEGAGKRQGHMGLFRKLPIHVGREREEFFVKPVETFGSRMDAQDLICAPACHVHRICSKNINVLVSSNMKHSMPKQYVYACMIIKQKICSWMIQVPAMPFKISEKGLSINPELWYSTNQNNEVCKLPPNVG
jgi:hypothetical protein